MSTEDILYSPIRREVAGRVFENFTAAPTTGSQAPFADTPGPDTKLGKDSQHFLDMHRQHQKALQQQQMMNEKIQAEINAQRQYGYGQYQQAMQNLQQQSLQQQFEQAMQNPSFQQTVQPQYGLGYQNLYANTTAGTSSSGLNQSNCLGSYNGLFGSTAASNNFGAYNGISAATKCPITGRNTITEAQATAKIASFL